MSLATVHTPAVVDVITTERPEEDEASAKYVEPSTCAPTGASVLNVTVGVPCPTLIVCVTRVAAL